MNVAAAARVFLGDAELVWESYGSGHINDTFRVGAGWGDNTRWLLLQRLNSNVFPEPERVMANIAAVSAHLERRLVAQAVEDRHRRMLKPVAASDGRLLWRDAEGAAWRAYELIADAVSVDVVMFPRQAEEAARAFGRFQRLLLDYDGPPLVETLPGFHDTPRRFATFERVLAADPLGRAASCRTEIDQVLSRRALAGRLLEAAAAGVIPQRVTHNDTKVNNVLLDQSTGEGLAVIDLDTVMPGLSLYDFGDLVRTATRRAPEDETNLAVIDVDVELFAAVAAGYLSEMGPHLTAAEKELLVISGQLITFEVGMRFLTDYLEGDVYFKTHHPGHNLDRARSQLAFVEVLERRERELKELVAAELR